MAEAPVILSTDYKVQYKMTGDDRWIDDVIKSDVPSQRANDLWQCSTVTAVRTLITETRVLREKTR